MAEEEEAVMSRQDSEAARGSEDERGDAAESDAPTAVEPNEAMGTILSADQPLGVQKGATEE